MKEQFTITFDLEKEIDANDMSMIWVIHFWIVKTGKKNVKRCLIFIQGSTFSIEKNVLRQCF